MDFIFNANIPSSTASLIILPPLSKTFINGLAQKYCDKYPPQLENIIEKDIFFASISQINAYLATFWPCMPAFLLGYGLSCLTCGCSFYLPYMCIKDAENMVDKVMEQQNKEVFNPKGLKISLQKNCSTSWIQIQFLNSIEMLSFERNKCVGMNSETLL